MRVRHRQKARLCRFGDPTAVFCNWSSVMRGRKGTPTALKRIRGNPGKRPINGQEPKPPSSQPTCLSHLSSSASAEWKRLAASLNRIGLLTQVDRAVLAAYCQPYRRWV